MVGSSSGAVSNFTEVLLNLFVSLDIMGTVSGNPFRGILAALVVSLIMGYLCYRILRKTEMA